MATNDEIKQVVRLQASAADLRAAATHSPRPYRKPYRRIADQIDEASSDLLTLSAIRGEYARFLTHRDTYELTRAVGQILNGPDDSQQIRYEMAADEQVDMLPESERRIVERPGDTDG